MQTYWQKIMWWHVSSSSQYGDYDPNFHKPGFLSQDELLPKRVSLQDDVHSWLCPQKQPYQTAPCISCLICVCAPGLDAVPNDGWHVGGEDHSLVCRAPRHRQVGPVGEIHTFPRCLVLYFAVKPGWCFLHWSVQGWGWDGVSEDRSGPWDVWCQLLCHHGESKFQSLDVPTV